MRLIKKLLNKFHPFLKPMYRWYLSKPRLYSYDNIKVKVFPGVFHPGLFFSTKVLIEFLSNIDLNGKRMLELGAGSGLISIYCARRGAKVTSSDINDVALAGLQENKAANAVDLTIVKADVLDGIDPKAFDIIVINPPYYPKNVESKNDYAWFCGENFQYFKKLFASLGSANHEGLDVYMILSEDCKIDKIASLSEANDLRLDVVFRKVVVGEENVVYRVR
jgi:release factor glutamine methyltransferase